MNQDFLAVSSISTILSSNSISTISAICTTFSSRLTETGFALAGLPGFFAGTFFAGAFFAGVFFAAVFLAVDLDAAFFFG